MKSILAVLVCVVCLFLAGHASACNVATVSAFGVVDHCGVAVQAVPVQAFAVQSYAVPTVAVFAQPVEVQTAQVFVRNRGFVRVRDNHHFAPGVQVVGSNKVSVRSNRFGTTVRIR